MRLEIERELLAAAGHELMLCGCVTEDEPDPGVAGTPTRSC
jgi:hypothetical protein